MLRPSPVLLPFFIALSVALNLSCTSKPKTDETQLLPSENPSAIQQGENGAVYNLPVPSSPQGQSRVRSVGITDLKQKDRTEKLPALHLQMVVRNNNGNEPWTLDSRSQVIRITDENEIRPAFVRAPGASLPFINIAPGESRTIDLYYVLPEGRTTITEIPGFTLNWQVQAGRDLVAETTHFDRTSRDENELSTYPALPRSQPSSRGPASVAPTNNEPPVGVESDWWMDPFSDLPFPWQEQMH